MIMGVLLILYEEHRNHKFVLYFIGSFGITYLINDFLLKHIFVRPRPFVTDLLLPNTSYVCPTDYSFPSTHAATAFAAATILASFDPKRKYIYYLGAIIVSFSRIYLGCHYAADVLAGGLIGALISRFLLSLPLSYNRKRPSVHKK